MTSVAEGLVDGGSAAAQSHSVSYLIGRSIFGLHGDASLNVKWTAATERGILNDSDGWRKLRFNLLPSLLVVQD